MNSVDVLDIVDESSSSDCSPAAGKPVGEACASESTSPMSASVFASDTNCESGDVVGVGAIGRSLCKRGRFLGVGVGVGGVELFVKSLGPDVLDRDRLDRDSLSLSLSTS